MKNKYLIRIYFLVGFINLTGHVIHSDPLIIYSKPLLMPLLILYLYRFAEGAVTLPRLLLLGALIFSWVGDLLLMKPEDEMYFLGGLGAFFIAQVIYLLTLYKSGYRRPGWSWGAAMPFVIYTIILLLVLLPKTGSLLVPVLIYGLSITMMGVMASLRRNVTSVDSYNSALTGAVLFILSDSLLAIDKFIEDLPYAGVWVMMTYLAAQYFLVTGILRHQPSEPSGWNN